MFSETIELRGHIIDSLILPKVLDQILTRGASFKITEIKIGQNRADQSFARIEVSAKERNGLDELVLRLRQHGAEARGRATRQSDRGRRFSGRFLRHDQSTNVCPD
jgi:hypothetical protein